MPPEILRRGSKPFEFFVWLPSPLERVPGVFPFDRALTDVELVQARHQLIEGLPHGLDVAKRSVLGRLEASRVICGIVSGHQRKRLNGQHRSVHEHLVVANSVAGCGLQCLFQCCSITDVTVLGYRLIDLAREGLQTGAGGSESLAPDVVCVVELHKIGCVQPCSSGHVRGDVRAALFGALNLGELLAAEPLLDVTDAALQRLELLSNRVEVVLERHRACDLERGSREPRR